MCPDISPERLINHMMTATASILPPGPRPVIPSVNIFALRRDPIKFLTNLVNRYGDLVYFKLGPQPVFMVNNPDYIRDVLVTGARNFMKGEGLQRAKRLLGEGGDWLSRRSIAGASPHTPRRWLNTPRAPATNGGRARRATSRAR